jgi:hypothetical protein
VANLVTILDNRSNLIGGVVESFDSGILDTGAFVFPFAHGLSTTPSTVFLLREIAPGDFELIDTSSFLIFDAVNIDGDFSALGSVNVRVIALGV